MFRPLVLFAAAVLAIFAGCSKDDNPAATPDVTSTVYQGSLWDTVLAAQLAQAHMNYYGTQYKYSLYSDNTFKVDENVIGQWTTVPGEEGTYTVSDSFHFTPTIDRHDSQNPPGTMVPTDSLRHAYTGILSNDTLTISNFINIDTYDGWRNLGTLTLKKQ